jgi:hypothetical protein
MKNWLTLGLIIGGLVLLGAGYVAGVFFPWSASHSPQPRAGAGRYAELDTEQFKKDWLYPGAGDKGLNFDYRRGNLIRWAPPVDTRSAYYEHDAPASFEKVVAFYEERMSKHLGVAAEDRPKFTSENEAPWIVFNWSKALPLSWEYRIRMTTEGGNGFTNAHQATIYVRQRGAYLQGEDFPARQFTIVVRRAPDANLTAVTLVYDWEAK